MRFNAAPTMSSHGAPENRSRAWHPENDTNGGGVALAPSVREFSRNRIPNRRDEASAPSSDQARDGGLAMAGGTLGTGNGCNGRESATRPIKQYKRVCIVD